MNLLLAEDRGRRRRLGQPTVSNRFPALAGTLLLGASVVFAFLETRSLDSRLRAAQAERDRLTRILAEREGTAERLEADRAELEALRVTERRLARWDEERFLLPELLRSLSLGVAEGVILEQLRREGGRLWITGRADSAAAVSEAAERLSRLDRLQALDLLWVERVEDAPAGMDQRFSLAGVLRYRSREPEPFGVVAPANARRAAGP